MSKTNQSELDLTRSFKFSIDDAIYSEIVYDSMVENYGEPAVNAVLEKLELKREEISLGDNSKIILRILNGEI